jgi:peptide chain release factor 1
MLETLKEIVKSYLSMQEELVSPASQADPKAMMNINKKLKSMEKSYELGKQYIAATNNLEEAKAILNNESDVDMIELAKEQMNSAEKIIQDLEPQIKVALLPKDPNDENNIFLEIRPAA